MGKLIAPLGILLGAAIWFLLFVILGTGIVTAFIAGGAVALAVLAAGAMLAIGAVFDAPLTATGLLLGIATFVILEVVLSVPLWVDVVCGLGVTGLYSIVDATLRAAGAIPEREPAVVRWHRTAPRTHGTSNGHDTTRREPVAAR